MASTASPLKQAGELGREAEEAAANGLFEEAAHKYLLAAQFFTDATKHTADVQMIQSLTLLAQTHRQRAEELQFYLEAARALQESGGDPFYQGSSLTYSTGYDDEDEDYEDDDEDYGVAGTRRDGAQQPGDGSAHLGGPSYWEGEEMVYARSSSPSSDPLLFVFTKDDARPVAESQFYEIDHSRLPEPSPGSGGGSGEDVELVSTWQRMFMGLDKLLDILPRSTLPTASQAVDGDMGHAVLVDGPDADVAGGGNSGSHNPAAESFVLVPSRSPSPEVDSSSSASSPKAMTGSGLLDYAQVGREDLVRELQRLSQTVEFLRGENAALLRAQEERREAKRENDMLKESILRFRREFERQTHHAKSTVPLSKSIVGGTDGHGGAGRRNAGGHPLAHSTIGHHKGQAHHRGLAQPRPSRPRLVQHAAALGGSGGSGGGSGRSLSSSSMVSRSSTASPPSSSPLLASSTCASSSSSSISSSPAPSSLSALAGSMSTSVSTTASPPPLSASTFWIQGLQMKRLKELEERNRALNQQLKQLRKQVAAGDRRIVALEDENRRQRETIDKYDERWKRLERSAREKMKQRQQSLSRTSSTPAATSTSSTSPPSSSKSSSAAMAIPGSLSEGQRGLLPMLAIPALASSPSSSSSPLSASPSSSPSSSFLMQAASSSLLSPSSSLFLRASSIGDDVREQ